MLRTFTACLIAAPMSLMAQLPQQVGLDQAPPALKVSRWVKGAPVPALAPGTVYVVEFWATWCHPCVDAIPHLTKLAKTYAGKAIFIGVNVWERGEAAAVDKSIDAFVARMGDKMDYHIARDTADGFMGNAWLKAAGIGGIPTTFIVNAEGRIAWIGHPGQLDKILPTILDGTYDLAGAKATMDAEQTKVWRDSAFTEEIWSAAVKAEEKKDYLRELEIVALAESKFPEKADRVFTFKFRALLMTAPDQAKALVDTNGTDSKKAMQAAEIIVEEEGLNRAWYEYALKVIEPRATATVKGPELPANFSVQYAKALFLVGRNQEAVAVQRKLIVDLRKHKASKAYLADFLKTLERYRTAAKGTTKT